MLTKVPYLQLSRVRSCTPPEQQVKNADNISHSTNVVYQNITLINYNIFN